MGRVQRCGTVELNPLVILGATGSIGRQALEVAAHLDIPVVGLAAGRWSPSFAEIVGRHPDAAVAVAVPDPAAGAPDRPGTVSVGSDAVAALAAVRQTTVVNGVVGAAGLGPSMAALGAGNRLALANKETLVAGGDLVTDAARRGGGSLIPVDSEHSALWQCLVGEDPESVSRLVLTASGGPFRGRTRDSLESVTPSEALAHPTWNMGRRISIDSATLVNKALEVIEAHHLFAVDYDRIGVVVHPQSIVHSLVEFVDGSSKAQMGDPDMKHPIQYAITYPERHSATAASSLAGKTLTFEDPDHEAFPALQLGFEAGRRGGVVPAAFNAADEVAVDAFLDGRIPFLAIADILADVVAATPDVVPSSVDDIIEADRDARLRTSAVIDRLAR